jgi:hypothetical protein
MKVSRLLPLSRLLFVACAKVEPVLLDDFRRSTPACSNDEEANACRS